jgi:hypothetical protein
MEQVYSRITWGVMHWEFWAQFPYSSLPFCNVQFRAQGFPILVSMKQYIINWYRKRSHTVTKPGFVEFRWNSMPNCVVHLRSQRGTISLCLPLCHMTLTWLPGKAHIEGKVSYLATLRLCSAYGILKGWTNTMLLFLSKVLRGVVPWKYLFVIERCKMVAF